MAAEVGTPRTRELLFFSFLSFNRWITQEICTRHQKKKSNHECSRKYLHNSHHSAWVTQTDAHDRVKTRVHSASTNNSRAVWPQCSYKLTHTKKSPAVFKKKKKKQQQQKTLRSHKAVNEVVTKFKHRLRSAPHTNTPQYLLKTTLIRQWQWWEGEHSFYSNEREKQRGCGAMRR